MSSLSTTNPNLSGEQSTTVGHPQTATPSPGGNDCDGLDERTRATTVDSGGGRTGILLVNHGSHSAIWRRMLLDVHDQVARELLALPGVAQVRTAFMEYTEPSIATQLRAFDADGVEFVLVVPLLLTISDHSFDDIPTICGLAADRERLAQLRRDRIEVYRASARLDFAPLLDFSGLMRTSLARRIRAVLGRAMADRGRIGLVLVGYGSADAGISAATADVAVHRRVDFGCGRRLSARVRFEEGDRAHDLAALAVAALRHVVFEPCGMHGGPDAVGAIGCGFDCGELFALGL